jgi:cobyrinic acid a,c-diamide synthase
VTKHAFLIAGTHSGCGKTTLSLALMAAFRSRGLTVQPFKVGPDFIDPGFHTLVTGNESRNLDGWMCSREYNRALFGGLLAWSDVAIVEGVMGLFDGYDGLSESGSSAEMAKWQSVPVVLVVDARSMARSAAALVHGYTRFDPALKTAGVIFNRIGGEAHLAFLKEAMAANLPEIPVLGGIPRDESIAIPERHLGLVTSHEVTLSPQWQQHLTHLAERYLDLDRLLTMTTLELREVPPSTPLPGALPQRLTVPIAVARDAAFCFYYPDNFDLLREAGADLRFFSPLAGEEIPPAVCGIYLGGGYPEVFAHELSAQARFLDGLRSAAAAGMPIYGECGGLMALSRFIETTDGNRHPMAGLLPFGTRMLTRRKALGYTEVRLAASCHLGNAGLRIHGHEFHYSEIVESDGTTMAEPVTMELVYRLEARKHREPRLEGYRVGSVLASYVHQHWGSAPEAAASLVRACMDYALKG